MLYRYEDGIKALKKSHLQFEAQCPEQIKQGVNVLPEQTQFTQEDQQKDQKDETIQR